MQILELKEEADSYFARTILDDEVALRLLNLRKFEVDFPSPANAQRYRLRSKGWVGHIPLKGEIAVRILPKIAVGNLFRMLDVAYNLQAFHLFDGTIQVQEIADVFEKLASILAKRVLLRSRKGLYSNYITERDSITNLKGRLNIPETIKSFHYDGRLNCEYQDFTPNLEENQILLWTLQILPKFGFMRPQVSNEIRRARKALLNTVDLKQMRARDCLHRFYHRLNSDYRPLHGICRFFLENGGPGLEAGNNAFIPFLINMPLLFESFVAEWLKLNLPSNFVLKRQFDAKLDANADLKFRIDLVVEEPSVGAIAVLDTKHKDSETPTETDIQKAVAYALRMGTRRAFLVYSSKKVKPISISVGPVIVQTITFDISDDPCIGGQKFLAEFLQVVSQDKGSQAII